MRKCILFRILRIFVRSMMRASLIVNKDNIPTIFVK